MPIYQPKLKDLKNSINKHGIKWRPGMQLTNSNGNIDTNTLGYQYTIQTTTLIDAEVIEQKFYEVPFADYVNVKIGSGSWMESIQTNVTYNSSGDFFSGITTVSDPSNIPQVSTAMAPINAKIATWNMGYTYSMPEIEKALAGNNWDVIASKKSALKKAWDLGLQEIAFLGWKQDLAGFPGLYSNPQVNTTTAIIQQPISTMDSTAFQTLVATILGDYFLNSDSTQLPTHFLMPMDDYLGMAAPVSAQYPTVLKIDYLLEAFKKLTKNPNFQIDGIAYGSATNNAGFWSVGGTNRYVLYKKDEETIHMFLPVDFLLNAPGTANNYNWQGIAAGQFTGAIAYRPAQIRYYDWS